MYYCQLSTLLSATMSFISSLDEPSSISLTSASNSSTSSSSSKVEAKQEVCGLDDDSEEKKFITIYQTNSQGEPVGIKYKLTHKELSLCSIFFDRDEKTGEFTTTLQGLDEEIPIPFSWTSKFHTDEGIMYKKPINGTDETEDVVYALDKCVEWMKYFDGKMMKIISMPLPPLKNAGEFPPGDLAAGISKAVGVVEPIKKGLTKNEELKKLHQLVDEIKLEEKLEEKMEIKEALQKALKDGLIEPKIINDETIAKIKDVINQRKTLGKEEAISRLEEKKVISKEEKTAEWVLNFINKIGADSNQMDRIYQVILCSNYLAIKPLLHLACAYIASKIKRKPMAEVANILGTKYVPPTTDQKSKDEKKEDSSK